MEDGHVGLRLRVSSWALTFIFCFVPQSGFSIPPSEDLLYELMLAPYSSLRMYVLRRTIGSLQVSVRRSDSCDMKLNVVDCVAPLKLA